MTLSGMISTGLIALAAMVFAVDAIAESGVTGDAAFAKACTDHGGTVAQDETGSANCSFPASVSDQSFSYELGPNDTDESCRDKDGIVLTDADNGKKSCFIFNPGTDEADAPEPAEGPVGAAPPPPPEPSADTGGDRESPN